VSWPQRAAHTDRNGSVDELLRHALRKPGRLQIQEARGDPIAASSAMPPQWLPTSIAWPRGGRSPDPRSGHGNSCGGERRGRERDGQVPFRDAKFIHAARVERQLEPVDPRQDFVGHCDAELYSRAIRFAQATC